MNLEVNNLDILPIPLKKNIIALNNETDPFRKIHRLIDTAEVFVKIHTVILINVYLTDVADNKISERIKGILSAGLKTPSLGIWWWFTKEFAIEIQKIYPDSKYSEIEYSSLNISRAPNKPKEMGSLFKIMEGDKNFINFRNSYAHGATPANDRCENDLKFYTPKLKESIQNAYYFSSIKIQHGDSDVIYTYFKDRKISLTPLLYTKKENKDIYFFYNDYRSDKVGILNYDLCLHDNAPELKRVFLDLYPLEEWDKSSGTEDFKARVEILAENFEGRKKELDTLLKAISEPKLKGFYFIWGGPGIGKSALLARLSQILKWNPELRKDSGIDFDFNGKIYVLEYFIRRDMGTNNASTFSNNLLVRLEKIFTTGVKAVVGGNPGEALNEALKRVSERLSDNEKLILLIDGLDEGEEDDTLLRALPKISFNKILIMYSSRETGFVKEKVFDNTELENRKELYPPLSGLSIEDTRAFLSRYVNKYEVQDSYINYLVKVSEGNPLYIKLVSQELQSGALKLNDIGSLPKELGNLYDKILKRYQKVDLVFSFLQLLAAAKDFVTPELAGILLNTTTEKMTYEIIPICRESLQENTLTKNYDDYQLFHESLREYLKKNYQVQINQFKEKWLLFCERRKEYLEYRLGKSFPVYRYAVLYYPTYAFDILNLKKEIHRGDDKKKEELEKEFSIKMSKFIESEEERLELFTVAGVAEPLQNAIHNLQKILRKQKLSPELKSRIIKYSKWYDSEPERLYSINRDRISTMINSSDNSKYDDILQICHIGITPERKSLLLLRGAFKAGRRKDKIEKNEASENLNESFQNWLEDSGNNILLKLAGKILVPNSIKIGNNFNIPQILIKEATEKKSIQSIEIIDKFKLNFKRIPAGSFIMGARENDNFAESSEFPAHKVIITNNFEIGMYPVTQEEWYAIMRTNPSQFKKEGRNNPVENVSFEDTKEFIIKLNIFLNLSEENGYRLPTEAEWEYSARAGKNTIYSFGNTDDNLKDYAWYDENSKERTHPVGQKLPNDWGLYDMMGNVWEWCEDWYDEDYYKFTPENDPQGPLEGEFKVFRGGAWNKGGDRCRLSRRSNGSPNSNINRLGFRLVRSL
jgi:hypothetical protein